MRRQVRARELRAVQLAAEGLTNAGIAERMFNLARDRLVALDT
jgi:DNA-binding NarL/FixJ family response regulator